MVRIGLFYRSFYKELREIIWRNIGVRLYQERNNLLLKLLSESKTYCAFPLTALTCKDYLLDIGAHDGHISTRISELHNLRAVCVDLTKNLDSHSQLDFLVADARLLPFKPNSFPMVASISLIEHIPEDDRRSFYNEIKGVIRDDGYLILQFPNRYFPIESHSFLPFVGYLPSKFHRAFSPDFVSVPSKSAIEEDLRNTGFIIVKTVEYAMPFFRPLKGLLKLFFEALPFGFLIIAKKRM